jgi:hypothetical protein
MRWKLVLAVTVAIAALPLPAVAAGSSLTLDRSTYVPGQSVVATYSTDQVSSTNWVGIYQSNTTPGSVSSLVWAYAPNASGSVSLSTSSLSPGSYRAYYLYNNGYTALTASVFFTVVSGVTTTTPDSMVCIGQTIYPAGSAILANYATTRLSTTNWIGVYADGQLPGGPPALVWTYAANADGSASLATGSLATGNYVLYYLYNNGYTQLAPPQRFTIGSGSTGTNLLVNGGGECGNATASGYDAVTIPGWQTTGLATAAGYNVGNGFPGPTTPGPSVRGNHFFAGGPVGNSVLSQTVNVSAASGAIDAGSVTYSLNGWLGGYAGEASTATVKATFRNASGAALSTSQIGPVTAADRGRATKLLQRNASGDVPAGTRTVDVVLQLTGDPKRNASNSYNDAYADNLSLTLSAPMAAPALPAPAASAVPAFDHIFFVMLENRTYDQVIGNSAAPYLNQLGNANAILTQSYGLVHPSDPNYMAVAGGSTFGHTDNPMPGGIGTLAGPHLGDLAEGVGKTWRSYVEDMGTPCNLKNNGNFDPDNAPFLFFQNVGGNAARCLNKLQPITQLWTDLQSSSTTPNFVWFEPNSCGSMHNCSVATGDAWMRDNLPHIFNSPAWTQQRSLLVITFDEDDSAHGQLIPTIIAGSPGTVRPGARSSNRYTHYNVLRTIESALGLARLTQNDQFASPINDIW